MPAAIVAAAITTAIELGAQVILGEIALSAIGPTLLAKAFAKNLIINADTPATMKGEAP